MTNKKKVVLITADILSFGGLETHIMTYVNACPHDRQLILCCKRNDCNQLLDTRLRIIEGLKYDLNENLKDLWDDIQKLVQIIQDEEVDLIQAHPFSNVIPAFFASLISKIPFVVTLHGPSSLQLSFGGLGSLLFFYSILNSSKILVVSEELKTLATKTFLVKEENILFLPNPIAMPQEVEVSKKYKDSALFIARLDELKVEGFKSFIKDNYSELRKKIRKIYVIGDGPARRDLEDFCQQYNSQITFIFLGYIKKPKEFFSFVSYVMGMGRVIIEALANSKEALLIGYDGFKGVVNQFNFDNFLFSNFSGRGCPSIKLDEVMNTDPPKLRQLLKLDSNEIFKKYVKWIDELVYESKPENETLLAYLENNLKKINELSIVDVERLFSYLSVNEKKEFDIRTLQLDLAKSRLMVEVKHKEIVFLHEYIRKANIIIKDLSERENSDGMGRWHYFLEHFRRVIRVPRPR